MCHAVDWPAAPLDAGCRKLPLTAPLLKKRPVLLALWYINSLRKSAHNFGPDAIFLLELHGGRPNH